MDIPVQRPFGFLSMSSEEDVEDDDMHSLSSEASTIALLPGVKNIMDVNDMNSESNIRHGYVYFHQLGWKSV